MFSLLSSAIDLIPIASKIFSDQVSSISNDSVSSIQSRMKLARRKGINTMSQNDAISILLDNNVEIMKSIIRVLNASTIKTSDDVYSITKEGFVITKNIIENLDREGVKATIRVTNHLTKLHGGEKKVFIINFESPIKHEEYLSFDIRNDKPTWFIDPCRV